MTKEYDIVSKNKYKGLIQFYFEAFVFKPLGVVGKSLLCQAIIYGICIYVITIPNNLLISKVLGVMCFLGILLTQILTALVAFYSKLVILDKRVLVKFGNFTMYKTDIAQIEKIVKVESFSGSYRFICRGEYKNFYFTFFGDTLPEELTSDVRFQKALSA